MSRVKINFRYRCIELCYNFDSALYNAQQIATQWNNRMFKSYCISNDLSIKVVIHNFLYIPLTVLKDVYTHENLL